MKFKKLLFVISFVTCLSLNAQDKEWFSSIPGDPSQNVSFKFYDVSFQTQNYLCWQKNFDFSILHLYNGKSWKQITIDSGTSFIESMDEQNDSIVILLTDYHNSPCVKLYDGSQWKRINKLKHYDYSLKNGVSSIKLYRNKLYAIFLDTYFSSSLVEYDFKTNSVKTISTFQQNPQNEVAPNYDKLEMHVYKNRLYISGAYDSANHIAAQGYGYYDGNKFNTLNIFPSSPINYSLVKQLDNDNFVVQRFYTVTSNDITDSKMYIIRNDSLISDITSDLYTKYMMLDGLSYMRHSYFQVYKQNGKINFFSQVMDQHFEFDPDIQRWHVKKQLFWDGYSFYFKNNRYVFNSTATLPYSTPSLGCFILKPKSYISGMAYVDLDDNCARTSNDILIQKQWIKMEGTNNTSATLSNNNGFYEMPLEPDNYKFTPYESAYSNSICSTGTIKVDSFKIYSRDVSHNFVAPYKTTGDIKIDMYSNVLRRGLNHSVTITLDNNGKPDLTVTPRLKFNPRIQFVSSSAAYSFKDQHTIVFDPVKVNKFKPIQIDLIFYLHPDSLAVGDSISWQASADSSNTEVRYDNNIKIYNEYVRGPYDPNHITGSYEGLVYTSPKTINYLVECQNLGTDTAFNVTIIDTIPNNLDIYSIKLLSSSSNNISATIKGNVVSFQLNQVRLTPKNLSDTNSKGFLIFSINLKDNAKKGDIIKNKAGIYFDYEAEVVTNTTAFELTKNVVAIKPLTIKTAAPFTTYPNPSTNHLSIKTRPGAVIESVKFYSITGQELLAETTNNIDFDISTWPNGLFFIVIKIDGVSYTSMNSKLNR